MDAFYTIGQVTDHGYSIMMNRVAKNVLGICKRKPLRLFLLIALLFSALNPAHVLAATDELPKLRVVTERIKPLVYRNPDSSKVHGYAANMVRDILHQSDIMYSFDILPWSRAYNFAINDPNVLIFMLARTQSREDGFIWLHHYDTFDFHLYGLQKRKAELSSDRDNFKNARIGGIRNDFAHLELEKIGYTNLITAENDTSLRHMLLHGRVDYVCSSTIGILHFELGEYLSSTELFDAFKLPLQTVPIYFALSKGTDPRIVARLKETISALEDIEKYRLPAIQQNK